MGIIDSSFLFLPFGNDLLVVGLVARNHDGYLIYVLSAVCGSTCGVFLLDVVARRLGANSVEKIVGHSRLTFLNKKIEENGAATIITACLAPPPFPFTMVVATNSALGYPRKRLLALVAICRAARFLVLGYLAILYGRTILRIFNSTAFKYAMVVFIVLCLIGSIFSVLHWFRRGQAPQPAPAT